MRFAPSTPTRIAVATRAVVCVLAGLTVAPFVAADERAAADAGDGRAPTVHASPEDGGPRRFAVVGEGALPLRDAPSATASTVAAVAGGEPLANLGCALAEGDVWCRVRPLDGGAEGHALAARLVSAAGPDGTVPTGTDDSERRARRRDFDAEVTVACAQERGEALGECTARVARAGGGDAAVVVTFPNGFARTLRFVHGAFASANATMSGTGTDADARMEEGLHRVRVDDQRYEIPDALVVGPSPERD